MPQMQLLEIDSEGRLRTKLYDKRDNINFPIVNFPFICSNIPAASCWSNVLEVWFLSWLKLLNNWFMLGKLEVITFTVPTMTWLAITEYLCHKWPWMRSVCRNHNPVLSSFIAYHWFVTIKWLLPLVMLELLIL